MSNSDNTSNSDDKLDALYKLTQQPDSVLSEDSSAEDSSPPDIDATIMAAAREATAGELATPPEEIAEPTGSSNIMGWQQRFGWATAATVLLTSALFISLVDNEPQLGALSSDEAVVVNDEAVVANEAPVAEQSPVEQSRFEADTGVMTISADAEAEFELSSGRAASSKPALQSMPQSAPASAPPSDTAAFSKRYREPESLREKPSPVIEEIVVTSRPIAQESDASRVTSKQVTGIKAKSERSVCSSHPQFLIGQVCTYSNVGSTATELRASHLSDCAGQTLRFPAGSKPPKPHASSTPERFVLQNNDTTKPPTEEIVCQSGKLVRQSLARGR